MSHHTWFAFALAAAVSPAAFAAPDGYLDPTFGQNGLQTVAFDLGFNNWDQAHGVAALPDGRILLAGQVHGETDYGIGLARLKPNGQIDEDFGRPWYRPAGVVSDLSVSDAALQLDGKLIVVGSTYLPGQGHPNALVCRFLPNGNIDTGFAIQLPNPLAPGCRLMQLDATSRFRSVTVQRDGRIALAGEATMPDNLNHSLVVRLDAHGNPDDSFGEAGIAVLLPGSEDDATLTDIAETPAGDLVAVGSREDMWQVFRLRGEDGIPDTDFNGNGLKTIDIDVIADGADSASAVSVLPDGRIVIGGTATGSDGNCPAAVRLHSNGAYDNTLDGDGLFVDTNACLPGDLTVNDMLVQSDGKIVLAGTWSELFLGVWSNRFFATRILPQGGFDPDFGSFNVAWFDFGPLYGVEYADSRAYRIANHAGRLLLVGGVNPVSDGNDLFDFAIARLDNDLIYADDLE